MQIAYRPDIDGLRSFAVLSVIGFHAFPECFPGGFVGVDIFFVISGYLITSIILLEHEKSNWRVLQFYVRRVLRIFPALILILSFVLVFGWHTLFSDEYKQLGRHIFGGGVFVSNFILWSEVGYFDRSADYKPLLHLWSLGIEEQFYILWPLLVWLTFKIKTQFKYLIVLLGGISFLLSIVYVFLDQMHAFYSPFLRAWELMLGASLLFLGGKKVFKQYPAYIDYLGIGCLILSLFFINTDYPFPGLLALLPTLATFLLIGSGVHSGQKSVVKNILSSRPMVYLGLISYPLYLWHWPLLSFSRILNSGEVSVAVRLMLVALSFLLSVITFHFVERPVRRLPRRLAVFSLIFLMGILTFLGLNIYQRDGLERIRYKRLIHIEPSSNHDFIDFETANLFPRENCDQPFIFPEKNVCLQNTDETSVTAVVLGDSHAVHAFWGLAKSYEKINLNLKVMGKGGCMPLLNYPKHLDTYNCQDSMNATLNWIASNPSIHRVAIVFRGKYLSNSSSLGSFQEFERSLSSTLSLMHDAGKEVDYFLPLLEPGFDPRLCIASLPFGRKPPGSCVINREEAQGKMSRFSVSIQNVLKQHPKVRVIDPNLYICSNFSCPFFQNGHSLFKDDNHLSYYGSIFTLGNIDLNDSR